MIQKNSRAWLAKRSFIIIYCCALMLQTYWRRLLSQKYVGLLITSQPTHEKDIPNPSYHQRADEQDIIYKKNELIQRSSKNYEMLHTIKWLAQNVKELRESIKRKKRCYKAENANSELFLTALPDEEVDVKKLIFLDEDHEFLSSHLRTMVEEIIDVQETAMQDNPRREESTRRRSQQTSIIEQEEAMPSRTARKEMQVLRKEVERLRKDILKTQSQIDIMVPTREYNLRMQKAAAIEICNLEKQKASLLCRYGKTLDKQRGGLTCRYG